jgi:hypothetical protein
MIGVTFVLAGGCASPWKISGGPPECMQMCRGWNMELVGMVGVGNQDPSGAGATACVCEIASKQGAVRTGSSGVASSSSAVIVAIQESEQQAQRSTAQNPTH